MPSKMIKFIGTSFSFYFEKLKRNYRREARHLRQTYITAENQYLNRISLKHSTFRTTEKHYLDRSAIATQLTKSGFRVFKKYTPSTLQGYISDTKKGTQIPESLGRSSGARRGYFELYGGLQLFD